MRLAEDRFIFTIDWNVIINDYLLNKTIYPESDFVYAVLDQFLLSEYRLDSFLLFRQS